MTHVTCRLAAKNRDQHRNPTLGNRVWATFTFFTAQPTDGAEGNIFPACPSVCAYVRRRHPPGHDQPRRRRLPRYAPAMRKNSVEEKTKKMFQNMIKTFVMAPDALPLL